jgi:hyaluronoglucosaminidase
LGEAQPWFQLEFDVIAIVMGVTITNRVDCCGDRLNKLGIYVGNQPAVIGAVMTNPVCSIFAGPSSSGSVEQITCTQPVVGQYLQIQRTDPDWQEINFSEIVVSFGIVN